MSNEKQSPQLFPHNIGGEDPGLYGKSVPFTGKNERCFAKCLGIRGRNLAADFGEHGIHLNGKLIEDFPKILDLVC